MLRKEQYSRVETIQRFKRGTVRTLRTEALQATRTFRYPNPTSDSVYYRGKLLTPRADSHFVDGMAVQQLVRDFGGVPHIQRVWTPESLSRSRLQLNAAYVGMVVSIGAALFCLMEGILTRASLSARKED